MSFDGIEPEDLGKLGMRSAEIVLDLAEAATDSMLTEAQLFLRFRKRSQELLSGLGVEFTDSTFGGKTSP